MKTDNLLDFGFNVSNQNYNIVFLAKITNYFLMFVLLFFAILNLFVQHNYILATVEIIFAFLTLWLIYSLEKNQDIEKLLLRTTINLLCISVLYYIFIDKVLYSSIWLFFFPLVVYLLNGIKIGTKLTLFYISLIIGYSYYGIGVFTDIKGFVHITIALVIFSFFVYQYEKSRKTSYSQMIEAANKLEALSQIDELTKLYNRHFLNNKILQNKELEAKPFLFCIADIDNFKAYNDHYGHVKGDETLKSIATAMKDTIQSKVDNYVIRLGGEEFGGFIFDVKNPKEYIEKFFERLNQLALEHNKNGSYDICTVSIGAVFCGCQHKLNFSKVYQLADEALYEAKENGRNKVVYKTI